jgi:hypothetical protein
VKSDTFKKFVRCVELENEVVELHQQLEKEVELHSSVESIFLHSSSSALRESIEHDLPNNVSFSIFLV